MNETMTLTEARRIALDLMAIHGLTSTGWRFDFDSAQKRLGATHFVSRKITLSRHFVQAASEEQVRQTMLHEVAHALLPADANHSAAWKAKARSIGYTGARTAVNPHGAAQRSGARNPALPVLDRRAAPAPKVGDTVSVKNRGVSFVGVVSNVTSTRVHVIRAADGVRLSCPKSMEFTLVGTATSETLAVITERSTPKLTVGASAIVTGTSRWAGRRGTIEAVGRTRYSINLAGEKLRVPFSLAQAA